MGGKNLAVMAGNGIISGEGWMVGRQAAKIEMNYRKSGWLKAAAARNMAGISISASGITRSAQ